MPCRLVSLADCRGCRLHLRTSALLRPLLALALSRSCRTHVTSAAAASPAAVPADGGGPSAAMPGGGSTCVSRRVARLALRLLRHALPGLPPRQALSELTAIVPACAATAAAPPRHICAPVGLLWFFVSAQHRIMGIGAPQSDGRGIMPPSPTLRSRSLFVHIHPHPGASHRLVRSTIRLSQPPRTATTCHLASP